MPDETLPAIIEPAEPAQAGGAQESARRLDEFVKILDEGSASGSIIKDLGALINEFMKADTPKYDRDGELIATIPDHATRVKGVEMALKCLKILSAETGPVFNGPVTIKWMD